MTKFKDKDDADDISSRNGAEWYHFYKNEFDNFNDFIKRRWAKWGKKWVMKWKKKREKNDVEISMKIELIYII